MKSSLASLHSTNKSSERVAFKTAVLKGQAPDGGLYFFDEFPLIDLEELSHFKEQSLNEIAFSILVKYITHISERALKKIINQALNFQVPIEEIDKNRYLCYLDKGPTASFKDVGVRFLARLLQHYCNLDNNEIIILVATSGDTGSAVANAFFGLQRIRVVILYPKNEVSDFQRKQMTTLGNNISAIGIRGKFDECQKLVKLAFLDDDLCKLNLTSANSINIGRLLPQATYYFYCYANCVEKLDEKVIFSVPSGNFGNLIGGLIAKKMNLPVKIFIAAVNENDVFPRFMQTGQYDKIDPSKNCLSNAMNVGNPSNMARLFELYNGQLNEQGVMVKTPDINRMRHEIASYSISDSLTEKTIQDYYQRYNKLIEPHGAVGWAASSCLLKDQPQFFNHKIIHFETASPAKFKEELKRIIHVEPLIPKKFKKIDQSKEFQNCNIISNYYEFKLFLQKNF
jgi:threonine synthase